MTEIPLTYSGPWEPAATRGDARGARGGRGPQAAGYGVTSSVLIDAHCLARVAA
jgi:hypothetical protein